MADLQAGPSPVLDCLGVTIGTEIPFARTCSDLPRSSGPPHYRVTGDDAHALAELTRLTIEHTALLTVHSAVVAHGASRIAMPGASGLGKSTLAAALTREGFSYVSDEVLALRRDNHHVVPFPRPFSLARPSWPALALPTPAPEPGAEVVIPVRSFGRATTQESPLTDVVLAQRRPGPIVVRPALRADVFGELMRRSFNHYRDPRSTFDVLTTVARDIRVWQVRYDEAAELAGCFRDALGL